MAGLLKDVDLTPHNSFAVPARAAWFADISDRDSLEAALAQADSLQLPLLILGGGTNCLFLNDYPGVVLRMANRGVDIDAGSETVTAAAGENWHQLVKTCLNKELHGLENLALIPGTAGAAPIQNIGAYGVELAQFFVSLEAVDLRSGTWREFDAAACEFGYRDSFFKRQSQPNFLIFSLTLQLARQWRPQLQYAALQSALAGRNAVSHRELFDSVCEIRRSKLPDPASIGNAGSFFKNPVLSRARFEGLREDYPALPGYEGGTEDEIKVPAAWLLEQAGWKGRRHGTAAVHEDHALVLINRGGASGAEIYSLALEMRESIAEKFGIELEPEVRIITD